MAPKSKQHECLCGADLARYYGVHRTTITRNLHRYYSVVYGKSKQFAELGHEFLLPIAEAKKFEKWAVVNTYGSLQQVIVAYRKQGKTLNAFACQLAKQRQQKAINNSPSQPKLVSLWDATDEGPLQGDGISTSDIANMLGVKQSGVSVWASKWVTSILSGRKKLPKRLAYRAGRQVHLTGRGYLALRAYVIEHASPNSKTATAFAKHTVS